MLRPACHFFILMDRQLLINKAREIKTRTDFLNLMNEIKADLLNDKNYPFSMQQLVVLCNPKNVTRRYRVFEIPKKTGAARQICAPCGNLKWFQTCLNELFNAIYSPSMYATGFAPGKSIVDNALMHTNQNYVFNIDLKDFFSSIDQARVWKRLQQAPFNFNKEIASIIAGLCSIESVRYTENGASSKCFVLPQGAPTSPLLTNAVCDTLDRRLHGLAKRFGLHYSRYADDITFSSMHNIYQSESDFRKELERIITSQHFTINPDKTRLLHCSKRQEVTGLTVSSKINVSRKYVKDIRAILHIWEKYGYNSAYASFYPHYKSEKCQLHRGVLNLVNVISGKLCYLKMVKGANDPVYNKLYSQFLRLKESTQDIQPKVNIEYLLTWSKDFFENKFGVTLEFKERTHDKKVYGCFHFQGQDFIVAISKNIDINNLPKNVQISLTRMVPNELVSCDFDKHYHSDISKITRVGYLLHKPLRGYRRDESKERHADIASHEFNEFVINFTNSDPMFHLIDNLKTIETSSNALLTRLVESNFDLSILP